MRVLLTGAGGQLGRALMKSAPADVELRGLGHAELDIADAAQVERTVAGFSPELIINAAAYTAVDKAESDPAGATRGNVEGPRHLSLTAKSRETRLIHVSTDFVFDGRACRPYAPEHSTVPLGIYGRSKLAGEHAVLDVLGDRAVIVRTAWLYAAQGNNFMRTMLRLMRQRGIVRVVDDQVGTPTAASSLAQAIWRFAARPRLSGVFHWTDAGVASWYDFAVAIAAEGVAQGLLTEPPQVLPIATEDYPTPTARPAFSVLDKRATVAALDLAPLHWTLNLRETIRELAELPESGT